MCNGDKQQRTVVTMSRHIDLYSYKKRGSPRMDFNICCEVTFQEAIQMIEAGTEVSGQFVNNIRNACDAAILAYNTQDLQAMVYVSYQSSRIVLNLNISKTKHMI